MSNQPSDKKGFFLTNLSLKNKVFVYLITFLILVGGLLFYNTLPKEAFPEVKLPQVYISTIYVGNTPKDVENLITKPIEKKVKTVERLKKVTSTSVQGYSAIVAHFEGDVNINKALLDVKDAVDKAKSDLPTDLEEDPSVTEINFSKFPVVNINLSGDFSIKELNRIAEDLQDDIEALPQIDEVNIRGNLEKEIQILVNLPVMELNKVSFNDIETAIRNENLSISGGNIEEEGRNRTIRTIGQFKSHHELNQIVVKENGGKRVYLRDLAVIKDGYKEIESYARLNNQSVVSLDIIKKSGENLLTTISDVKAILDKAKINKLPEGLRITLTNDQSINTKNQLSNLINSIVMGVLLVVLVLQFFIGTKNALFVGLSIPLSMFLSFIILSFAGVSLNVVVLFALVLALGMLVDNGIVTVENIYRLIQKGYSPFQAARIGVSEIALPIISSTATTIAAFFPLLFWNDMMGQFMYYIPFTLIAILSSSLFVALVINPVLVANFIKSETNANIDKKSKKFNYQIISLVVLAILFYLMGVKVMGGAMISFILIILLSKFILVPSSKWFQDVFLKKLEILYKNILTYSLKGKHPVFMLLSCIGMFILSFILFSSSNIKTEFFPSNSPDYINVFVELPEGTSINITDKETKKLNAQIDSIINPYVKKGIVKSVMANVGDGTSDPNAGPQLGKTANKARITIDFVPYEERKGISTKEIMKEISSGIAPSLGVLTVVDKNNDGPPTGKPVSIEVSGDDFDKLLELSYELKKNINNLEIAGIEALKFDITTGSPELLIHIDRTKATELGISTAQVGSTIRTALFGKRASKLKLDKDDYDITIKLQKKYRNDLSVLLNQKITFRNVSGKIIQVPISSVISFKLKEGVGMINRYNKKRAITIQSNVLEGYNANIINEKIKSYLVNDFNMPEGFTYRFSGEQEDQAKTFSFLSNALLIAICLIVLIMVAQFNSIAKPFVIILTVLFSLIGVLLGFSIFHMNFVIIMTGIGIISLAGIVVNNAIVLIDCIDQLKAEKKVELAIPNEKILPGKDSTKLVIMGGVKRLRPVLLTAITTILGLIPLAIGFNIDFVGLLTNLSPNMYWGGNNAAFWGPMAWTIIFGLFFATFLTLVMVPVLYILLERVRNRFAKTQ